MDDGDARRKFCIKLLKEINHGVLQGFLTLYETMFKKYSIFYIAF